MPIKLPAGFYVLHITGILILIMLFAGQMMAFINYDWTVSVGLQESVEAIGLMGVEVNKAFGVGDTVIYIPLMIAGLLGVWFRKTWGLITMSGSLAITAYWPVTCMFILLFGQGTPGFTFDKHIEYGILLSLITLYGIWGMFYLYRYRKIFD